MSQEQLDRYFKNTIELIHNNSKDYFEEDEMDENEYRKCMGDILKTFLNKFHTFQSQAIFANINGVKFNNLFNGFNTGNNKSNERNDKASNKDYESENESDKEYESANENEYEYEFELNKDDFNTSNIISSVMEFSNSDREDTTSLPTFDINDIIRHQNAIDSYSNFDDYGNSSDPEFETQCCARVDGTLFKIDDYSSEFLDKYPAGVFITNDGYVVGKPCRNMIPDEEFDEGNIFCEEHNINDMCEDIREIPKNFTTD